MKKRMNLLPVIVILTAVCTWRPAHRGIAAAVIPVDQGQELYERIRSTGKSATRAIRATRTARGGEQNKAVLLVGQRSHRGKKMFSAAQFVCGLPIEAATFSTLCSAPSEAAAAVRKIKEKGFDAIKLDTPASGEVYEAIVKTAREQDMRISA